ncbi:glycosyltransferase [Citrobacter freundii]|uniref:glycosyltransferase n=1 Tax=Citrobacter freundii TaxID=546 RepID=UPI003F924C53
MKKLYICRDFTDTCGISKYGQAFYSSVLKPNGYEKVHLKDKSDVSRFLFEINTNDKVWFEIGLGSYLETLCLKGVIDKKNPNVVVTIHDAPFIEYPIVKFKSRYLDLISKGAQYFLLRWPFTLFVYDYLQHAKRIYTLNPKGTASIRRRYNLSNVITIPHILQGVLNVNDKVLGVPQLLYFGFIGKNKGVEYALKLHEKINEYIDVPIVLKVIGKALDKNSEQYLQVLKKRFHKNVEYLGYVQDSDLDAIMREDNIVLLPTRNYKVITPTSGSVLNSLKYLNIVFTTQVNANQFLIKNNENGFFLVNDIERDVQNIINVVNNPELRISIRKRIYSELIQYYSSNAVIDGIQCDDYD